MADMLKFYKGLVGSLPTTGANGALYITTDEGGIYLGTGTGMKRLGDFVQVENVASLPAKAHENCLYYCVAENILAKWNGTEWKQVNKQPTTEELKSLLGLGSMAYVSEISESNLSAALAEKVNASAEGNHSHANKALLDTYTQTEADLADAVAKKHEHANKAELDKIVAGDKAKWDGVAADYLKGSDKTALEDSIADVATAVTNEEARAKAAEKANADAIVAIKDGTSIDSFADVEAALAGKQATGDYATKAEAQAMADGKDAAIAEAKKAGTDAAAAAGVVAGDLAAHIADANGKFETKTDASAKLTEAKGYTDAEVAKVQGEVDALETYVGVIPEGYTEASVIAYINKKAQETLSAAQGGSSETAASVLEALNTYKSENDPKVQANTDAIDAIEADYLKAADKTELAEAIAGEKTRAEGIEGGLRTDVDAIKADYLKAADKKALQDQIDLIMSNPDTENVINSISEFTQYIADHGEIAEGFRTDIDANAQAIEDLEGAAAAAYETKTDAAAKLGEAKTYADGLNTAMDTRVKVLEGINHNAYVAADAALKAELQGEIDADVKALADGQVAANTAAIAANDAAIKGNTAEIAKKANSADVYLKTETYSQAEVDAMFQWGSF